MKLNNCVLSFLNSARNLMSRKLCDITDVDICPAGYKTNNQPPVDGWSPYDVNFLFAGDNTHFWFRSSFRTPSVKENEYIILHTIAGKDDLWDATSPQGLLYLNGKMVQGLDSNHPDVFLDADTDYDLHSYFYMSGAAWHFML